jgi:hypothetical protein
MAWIRIRIQIEPKMLVILTPIAAVLLPILAGVALEAAVHDTAHAHLVPHLQNNENTVPGSLDKKK